MNLLSSIYTKPNTCIFFLLVFSILEVGIYSVWVQDTESINTKWSYQMSSLSSLKLVSATKPQSVAPIITRRSNLSSQLAHQIELARALSENRQYIPTRMKTIKDKASGERRTVETNIRLKPMWFTLDNKVYIQIKYSNRVLELAKGKNSAEISSPTELINGLTLIKQVVDGGQLDTQIEQISKSVRARFVK